MNRRGVKKYDSYKYIVEDSFFVQIKSSSATEILFKGNELKWLYELQLPLFIAAVDRTTSTIKIYSTQSLSNAFVENPNKNIVKFKLLEDYQGDLSNSEESNDLPIGPAIIEWSLNEFETNPNFHQQFYDLMKAHISLVNKSIETRRVGYVDLATWKTGIPPKVYGQKLKGPTGNFAIDEISGPYFHSIINNLSFGEDISTTKVFIDCLSKF